MNKLYIQNTVLDISRLSVFAAVREAPLLSSFKKLLLLCVKYATAPSFETGIPLVEAWADFSAALAGEDGGNLSFAEAVYRLAREDENAWTLFCERGGFDGPSREESAVFLFAKADLEALERTANFDFSVFESLPDAEGGGGAVLRIKAEASFLKSLRAEKISFAQGPLARDLSENGAGLLRRYAFFFWEDGRLAAAKNPDAVNFSDLFGYEDQRLTVAENTRRFLKGEGANNLLLYGDRGAGKSASVKAVCNEYAHCGLRLLQVRKHNFKNMGAIIEALGARGLKFILFIDDISFEDEKDDSFNMLKSLLEGGAASMPGNVLVYATSNRRHFVKENQSSRPSGMDDVRAFDTMQEQLSLADRFGVTVIFTSPSQDEYLEIACRIAAKRGVLDMSNKEAVADFRANALKWERWFNGRSPRTACQYVEWAACKKGFPWD
ncbi:MAG: ATP-binding protein [Spirochaetaceae bacterium]|jgi:predicted AAA+ superfamily ATPase|nr:ATP-binding protein [Spirochaetaceae bacterium]